MFKNQHTYNLDIKFRKGEGRTVKIDRQKDMWICVMLSRRQFDSGLVHMGIVRGAQVGLNGSFDDEFGFIYYDNVFSHMCK